MEPLLILVLRKVNPFTCFFQAFSLEFAQEAELPRSLNDWSEDLHEEAEINYSFLFFLFSVIVCLEMRLHSAAARGAGGWNCFAFV